MGLTDAIDRRVGNYSGGMRRRLDLALALAHRPEILFPLTFLTASFVPLALLDGWRKTAARANPITYVLEGMRDILNVGWVSASFWQGIVACLILAIAMYALAVFALRFRTRRS